MRVIAKSSYRSMPWKNGGGETTEIIVSPLGASLDDFDWRISMASIASDGPFSLFTGIDRTLSILAGQGLELAFPGRGAVRLDRMAAPFAFPADVPAAAHLVSGVIENLNVMTRRNRFRHHVSRMRIETRTELPRSGEILLVLPRGASATICTSFAELRVGECDAALFEPMLAEPIEVRPDAALELYVVDLWPM
jgi:uncharacterized protein